MGRKLGAMHMSNISTNEVQRTNNFDVVIDMDGSDVITLALDSFSLPTVSNDPIELAYGNTKVKVAGAVTTDNISCVVKDFIESDVEMILVKWRRKVYNEETDAVGWAKDYKKNGTVTQYGPDGTALRQWKLEGLWPTSLDLGELSYDGGDKKVITMDLSVDKATRV